MADSTTMVDPMPSRARVLELQDFISEVAEEVAVDSSAPSIPHKPCYDLDALGKSIRDAFLHGQGEAVLLSAIKEFREAALEHYGSGLDQPKNWNTNGLNKLLETSSAKGKMALVFSDADHKFKSLSVNNNESGDKTTFHVTWKLDGDFDTFDHEAFVRRLRIMTGNEDMEVEFKRGSVLASVDLGPLKLAILMIQVGIAASEAFRHFGGSDHLANGAIGGALGASAALIVGFVGAPVLAAGAVGAGVCYLVSRAE